MRKSRLVRGDLGAYPVFLSGDWATCYAEDGDLAIDNNATERAIRPIAAGRNNWTFFGSDNGGKTAAVFRSLSLPASW